MQEFQTLRWKQFLTIFDLVTHEYNKHLKISQQIIFSYITEQNILPAIYKI